ncbi:MAG: aminopeptidase P N-terminal domain-containing protein [Candidatus Aminicenantes bacterium]|nr:aminopeptidase P N-terminal domain-containing protein [Candidatus Aminicenantes bacterium]
MKTPRLRKRACASILLLVLSIPTAAAESGALFFDQDEYALRRAKLMEKISDGAAIVLGSTPATGYLEYFQNNDFMYFTGVEAPNAVLIIDGRGKTSTIFYTLSETAARGEGVPLDIVRNPKEATGIEQAFPLEQFTGALARLANRGSVLYTSFKPEELSREASSEKFNILQNALTLNVWDGRLTRELQFVRNLRDSFPAVEIKDASPMIWELRMIKSPAEIDHLRKVGRLGVEAHKTMMRATGVGVPEYEMSAAFEYACKKTGARDIGYNVIISSAQNHPYLHYYRHDRVLASGDFIVVDAGPNLDYYTVDISASYPADGRFTPRQREVYEAALAVEKACLEVYRPGITCDQVREEVRELVRKKGFDVDGEMFKVRAMQGGCSHYVGMAVHDVGGGPRGPLRPGMVFACDIYAVYAKEDLGVRVEDTVVITETGVENLTAGLPREISEIETFMKAARAGRPGTK